mmetsp:Transcript_13534/g.12011  ORF Transcript_13534/g.12011 Transcript_13534/m.12011 type:complete len:98 (+) Transcript_13534:585-878(+)
MFDPNTIIFWFHKIAGRKTANAVKWKSFLTRNTSLSINLLIAKRENDKVTNIYKNIGLVTILRNSETKNATILNLKGETELDRITINRTKKVETAKQ